MPGQYTPCTVPDMHHPDITRGAVTAVLPAWPKAARRLLQFFKKVRTASFIYFMSERVPTKLQSSYTESLKELVTFLLRINN